MITFQQSHVVMTELVLPQHTNAIGSIFGGVVMSWIDMAAAISAMRFSQGTVVTASIDALHFITPIQLGHIVNIKASVNFVGTSSCEVGVRIDATNPLNQEEYHCCTAYLTMVALDSNRRPRKMPKAVPVSEDEKRRYRAAELRRQARLELAKEVKKHS